MAHWLTSFIAGGFAGATALAACGDAGSIAGGPGNGAGGNSAAGGSAGGAADAGGGLGGSLVDTGTSTPTLEPLNPMVTVTNGAPQTVQFTVKLGSQILDATYSINRAEIGTIGAMSGLFTTATAGGVATVTAVSGTHSLNTTVTVVFDVVENGAGSGGPCPPGGCGGVGGEGAGGAIDPATQGVLDGAPTAAPGLTFLYPYNATVWPLGILAPLLQWTDGGLPPEDAIKIELEAPQYSYTGYFGRPPPLTPGTPFVRHPIPQAAWDGATHSARGGQLKARLTVAAGGVAYGPIEQTWYIASAPLKGTVYYQSYGTKLAKNYGGAIGGDGMFGGATLAIKGGSTEPVLVAGSNGGHEQCRVCHTVNAKGTRMIAQHGNSYPDGSSYNLSLAGYPETPYGPPGQLNVGWMGLYPDGTIGLGNAVPIPGGANGTTSSLLDATTGAPIPANGLSQFVTRAGMPAFSPDGKLVAFTFYAGPGDATIGPGDPSKLVVMSFDAATSTFSNPRLVYQGSGSNRPGWPAFLPTNDRLVFQVETQANSGGEYFATRDGARAELWWADLSNGSTYPLESANGTSGGAPYLPSGANNHGADHGLNYEPTVNPIVSGGYAWVVFTSRRMYGSVATIDPWWSDPRAHDLTQTPTPKKLWVAALDLPSLQGENPTMTTDPSHPAFYIPAQELLAGNTRGFWVPDPCKANLEDCTSGDECCGGFCTWNEQLMKNTCGDMPDECSQEYDLCTVDADCCDYQITGMRCINGRCAGPIPK